MAKRKIHMTTIIVNRWRYWSPSIATRRALSTNGYKLNYCKQRQQRATTSDDRNNETYKNKTKRSLLTRNPIPLMFVMIWYGANTKKKDNENRGEHIIFKLINTRHLSKRHTVSLYSRNKVNWNAICLPLRLRRFLLFS